ncbi:MAG: hypothetical protein IRZ08_22960, partial [Frankia sp.]|nr:hypothetical protein [Frankia sp.]
SPAHPGLSAAARMAATLSSQIAAADPDPGMVSELAERTLRIPPRLFAGPPRRLTTSVLADWRRAQQLLDRRLSPPVHIALLRTAGYLSYYLGLLAVDVGDDPSARRFATLAEQHAQQLDDPLLTGTIAGLDATIALAAGGPAAALASARRMAACGHPHLTGWAALFEASAAGALADAELARDALRRLRRHRPDDGGPHPGWPELDQEWVTLTAAVVLASLGDPAELAAAAQSAGAPGRGVPSQPLWAAAARAAAALADRPRRGDPAFAELVDLLGRWPSRLLAQWMTTIVTPPRPTGRDAVTSAGGAAPRQPGPHAAPDSTRPSRPVPGPTAG